MGVRGMAIRPAKIKSQYANSKSWNRRERRTCAGRLDDAEGLDEAEERLDAGGLGAHLQDDAVLAHVDDPGAKLAREDVERLHVLVSRAQRLAGREWLCTVVRHHGRPVGCCHR